MRFFQKFPMANKFLNAKNLEKKQIYETFYRNYLTVPKLLIDIDAKFQINTLKYKKIIKLLEF